MMRTNSGDGDHEDEQSLSECGSDEAVDSDEDDGQIITESEDDAVDMGIYEDLESEDADGTQGQDIVDSERSSNDRSSSPVFECAPPPKKRE